MNKIIALSLFMGFFFSFSTTLFAQDGDMEMAPMDTDQMMNVDLEKSVINWKAYKVTGSHSGEIRLKDGKFVFTDDVLSGGTFTIDMNSIKTTDMQGQGAAKLDGHLKSPDFFGVEAHPEGTFTITKVASRGADGDYKVTGNLTLKGITKEIKFNAMMKAGTATASLNLDRTDFNIKYGSGSFFQDLGDKTIYDEFDLDLVIQLK